MIGSHILLENIQAKLEQEDQSLPDSQVFIHILSRKSPYVYTNEVRFPVTERYIPWRVMTILVIFEDTIHNLFSFRSRMICMIQRLLLYRKNTSVFGMMNDHLSNRICMFSLFQRKFIGRCTWSRIKSYSNEREENQKEQADETSTVPPTPIVHSGIFGSFEMSTSPIGRQFTVPVLDSKWNQVVEYQLPNGKKVFRVTGNFNHS